MKYNMFLKRNLLFLPEKTKQSINTLFKVSTNLFEYLLFAFLFLLSCALPMDVSTDGINIIPTTASILPLSKGNCWNYSYSYYDSTGKCTGSAMKLDLEIPEIFELKNDTELAPFTYNKYDDSFHTLYYKYEYENLDSGLLVTHIGTGSQNRGLYITGKYVHSTYTLFKKPVLWFAFPADSGKTWTMKFEDQQDSIKMELISTNTPFYYYDSNKNGISPVKFWKNCYLYKETDGKVIRYYYFHSRIGALGYLEYQEGVLRVSYILVESNILP